MTSTDAFVVGEEFVSEHYFTSDSNKRSFQKLVADLRKEWDSEDGSARRATFQAERGAIVSALARLGDESLAADDLYEALVRALGFRDAVYRTEQESPVLRVGSQGANTLSCAVVRVKPVEAIEDLLAKDQPNLAETFPTDDGDITAFSRLASWLFASDDHPTLVLALAGRYALLTERERWPEGRWLAIDLQLVIDRADNRKGGEVDRAIACLGVEQLVPNADGELWWAQVFGASVSHTVGVSRDLRDGVRESIELIANEVVARRRANGREALPSDRAQDLATHALRYLYRVLFLLYAEASPELGVLPVGAPEYAEGYGLDRLRELVLADESAADPRHTHLYQSLDVLFRLVDGGQPAAPDGDGLAFESLKADLFTPSSIALISEVGLGDLCLYRVLSRLLLSAEKRGNDRGFISYADLGINQLGAVYEGLMSYTGFFAEEDLHEVAKDGDASKGSWVVPVTRSADIDERHFVTIEDPENGAMRPVLHRAGSFVYRLAGRERQQSASYYTPEVLTRFTVSQALEELVTPEMTSEDILGLTVCEPALGSGAFAIEAVRQLAECYLSAAEAEKGERVDPDRRPAELQKIKAYIALHNVYGVDLNPTAIELAEISLWLDTMGEGLNAPWFGLRLRPGNSLIGARRAVFNRHQLEQKAWRDETPDAVPVAELAENMAPASYRVAGTTAGKIHHFLVPSTGWGAGADAKDAKTLARDGATFLREWRKAMRRKPSTKQLDRMVALSYRVEVLWQYALQRTQIAEAESRRDIELWGRESQPARRGNVTRAQIEAALGNESGAYRRLRRVMDAWNALWFWPVTDRLTGGVEPPKDFDAWLDGIEALIGTHRELKVKSGNRYGLDLGGQGFAPTVGVPTTWDALDGREAYELSVAGAKPLDQVLAEHPWLATTEKIAAERGFFHWELDFAPVFARGGFDLQVGNPPWVRPDLDIEALLAEGDVWWALKGKSTTSREDVEHRERALATPAVRETVADEAAVIASTQRAVGDAGAFPYTQGLHPDLYRCFMQLSWRQASAKGVVGLIHQESHFTDVGGAVLRSASYRRLRRHWHFVNQLKLFEIGNTRPYGVHIYACERNPSFIQATNLFHPETAIGSLRHDGSGPEPGSKNDAGHWDRSAHANRVQLVNNQMIAAWSDLTESDDVRPGSSRMVYSISAVEADVLKKLTTAPRIRSAGLYASRGWTESTGQERGFFDVEWGAPDSWDEVILQGPNFFISNPTFQSPNETLKSHRDWTFVDLENLADNAIPTTKYKPCGDRATYGASYTHWRLQSGAECSAREFYRVAWRSMADNHGARTLLPALISPGVAHVHGVHSVAIIDEDGAQRRLVSICATMSSMMSDLYVRAVPKSGILANTISALPHALSGPLEDWAILRSLRLNAMTNAYAELVTDALPDSASHDSFATDDPRVGGLAWTGKWARDFPLRNAMARRQALLEIDALVALSLGVTADELCAIYRTQFAVLYGYDRRRDHYDANGRLVPGDIVKAWRKDPGSSEAERTMEHPGSGKAYTYAPPFATLDREADMRRAYAEFEERVKEHADG